MYTNPQPTQIAKYVYDVCVKWQYHSLRYIYHHHVMNEGGGKHHYKW